MTNSDSPASSIAASEQPIPASSMAPIASPGNHLRQEHSDAKSEPDADGKRHRHAGYGKCREQSAWCRD